MGRRPSLAKLRPTVRQLAGPRPAGYFCARGPLPPRIVDPSKVRPPIFSKGRNHSLAQFDRTRPACDLPNLDSTRLDPTQGRQHDEWGTRRQSHGAMRLCVDRLSTSLEERGGGKDRRTVWQCPFLFPLPPSRLPCAWLPSALCLGPTHPGAYPPASMNDRPAGGVGKYQGTLFTSVLHFGFATPASQSMILPLTTPRSWAEQSRKQQDRAEQSRAEPHFDRIRPSPQRGGELAVVFFWGSSAHRVLTPAEPEVLWIRMQTLRDRWTAKTDTQRHADRSGGPFDCTRHVLSCRLVSKPLGCRPWVVSQLHSRPCPAFLAATA